MRTSAVADSEQTLSASAVTSTRRLESPLGGVIPLEIEAIERVSHGPREGTFFFTYRVRVLSACVLDPSR